MKRSSTLKIVFAFITLALLSGAVYGQVKDSLISKFNTYRNTVLHEKIFLHTDRPSYICGETIWLKVYCIEASSNLAPDISKVAYVELIDREGKSVLQTKVALSNGKGIANIFIPATLNSDTYTVRAYTRWMMNFSDDYFFTKHLTIVNPFKTKPTTLSTNRIKED
jgi:hypothetical protein